MGSVRYIFIILLSLFLKKYESRHKRSLFCPCPPPPLLNLNAWTTLYISWFVNFATWTHPNNVLHKSFPQPLCLYVHPIFARQRYCKHVPSAASTSSNKIIVGRVVFMRSSLYLRRICVSAYVSPALVYGPLKGWSEGSRNCHRVKYDYEPRGFGSKDHYAGVS